MSFAYTGKEPADDGPFVPDGWPDWWEWPDWPDLDDWTLDINWPEWPDAEFPPGLDQVPPSTEPPGMTWPPGWPLPHSGTGASGALTLAVNAGAVEVGSAIALSCDTLEGGTDTSVLEYHLIGVQAAIGSTTVQLKKQSGDAYSNVLWYQVTNYTGGKYGFNASLYADVNADDAGSSLTFTCTVVSVSPNIAAQDVEVVAQTIRLVAVGSSASSTMYSGNGIDWHAVDADDDVSGVWNDICYSAELDLFVAVAAGGKVKTASNATIWTSRTSATSDDLEGICYSPELNLFVAVGPGVVITSPNGVDWTLRSTVSGQWQSVCWSPELSLFCAGGNVSSPFAMTSSDGITWSSASNALTTSGICWSEELDLFVRVGATTNVATSPDGSTWTGRTGVAGSKNAVCYSPELNLFVAVAQSGANRVSTSPDGVTWTGRSIAAEEWDGVCWSPSLGLFVAVNGDKFGTSFAATSPDGINWTARTAIAGVDWRGITAKS